jgi:hypothetical protein
LEDFIEELHIWYRNVGEFMCKNCKGLQQKIRQISVEEKIRVLGSTVESGTSEFCRPTRTWMEKNDYYGWNKWKNSHIGHLRVHFLENRMVLRNLLWNVPMPSWKFVPHRKTIEVFLMGKVSGFRLQTRSILGM